MLRIALLGIALLAAAPSRLPEVLVDLDGRSVGLAEMIGEGRLFVITLKSASCPVCARQLVRLERLRAGLERCGARFAVLSPGPAERIRRLRAATGFGAHWFEDPELALGRALDLLLGPDELVPAIVEIDAQGRVVWAQRGRSGELYGDGALQKHLGCELRDA
jgi:peroxiredoxin